MRLMFVYYAWQNQGSGLVVQGYTEAAKQLGHEVAVYGRDLWDIPLNYSLDIASADALVFIFEWTTFPQYGDSLDFARWFGQIPREKRIVIDGDGNYNAVINSHGDYNHKDEAASRSWTELCDSLSDKICQTTLHPVRRNVRPFLFYAYDPAWERPLASDPAEYSMVYVGHSKFRWRSLHRILQAIEPIRDDIGRIALVGEGWNDIPSWAEEMQMEDSYFADPCYLEKLGVEVLPSVPFNQVVPSMSRGQFNPVMSRPTFSVMELVTPRFFETPAANTIPLFDLEESHVRDIYGDQAVELTLGDGEATGKILDIVRRPEHYRNIVRNVRQNLATRHSHVERLKELIEIIRS